MGTEFKFNFNWVLINELAVGNLPITNDAIKILKKNKIISVLTLCSKNESKDLEKISKTFNYRNIILPDHTYNYDLNKQDIINTLEVLSGLIKLGPVFVHCVAAMERSPIISMAWLIKSKKLNTEQALDYLMQVNPGTNPLPIQLKVLNDFYNHIKNV